MLNFIRFDLKKLFSLKSLWVTLFIFVSLLAVTSFITIRETQTPYEEYLLINELEYQVSETEESTPVAMTREQYETNQEMSYENLNMSQFTLDNLSAVQLFAHVFFAIYLGLDFSSGYMKNMLALKGAKRSWILSKISVAIMFSILTFVILLGAGVIIEVMSGQWASPIQWDLLIQSFVGVTILNVLIIAILTFIALTFQSRISLVVIATLMATGIHHNILNLFGNVIGVDFTPYLYSMQFFQWAINGIGDYLTVIGMGLIYVIVFLGLSWLTIYRIDFDFEH